MEGCCARMVEQQWSTLWSTLASHRLVGGNQRPADGGRGSVVAGGIGAPTSPTASAELPRATQVRPSRRRGRRRWGGAAVGGGVGRGALFSARGGAKSGSREARLHTSTRSKRWLKSVPPPSADVDTPSSCTHGAHSGRAACGCGRCTWGCSLGARGLQPGAHRAAGRVHGGSARCGLRECSTQLLADDAPRVEGGHE